MLKKLFTLIAFAAAFFTLGGTVRAAGETAPVFSAITVHNTVVTGPGVTNALVPEGTLLFSSIVTGDPAPAVQWQKCATQTGEYTDIPGATDSSPAITVTAADNGWYYRGVATNTIDGTLNTVYSPIIKLNVVYVTGPGNAAAVAGAAAPQDKATFTVTPSAIDPSDRYYDWEYRTGAAGTWANVTSAQGTINGDTLTTVSVTKEMNGYQFRCLVSGGPLTVSATSGTATLTVYYAPTITLQPVAQTATSGEAATFTVDYDAGNPAATDLVWEYNDGISGWTEIAGNSGKTLTFPNLSTVMSGFQYRYKISNGYGGDAANDVYSDPAALTVNPIP